MENVKIKLDAALLQACQNIADIIGQLCYVPSVLLMHYDKSNMEVITASNHQDSPYKAGEKESCGHGLYCETVIKNQKALHVPNALIDPNWNKNPDIKLGMIAYYGVPVNWPNGTPFGTFCILDKKENHFSPEIKALVSKFSHVIEIILESAYQQKQLEETSQKDQLTGIDNRRAFMARFEQIFLEYQRYQQPFSLLYLDLDHFKNVNDTFGHSAGDQTLIHFCHTIKKVLRNTDIFARLGGEEFVVLFLHADKDTANLSASRICKAIESTPVIINDSPYSFTVSGGLTSSRLEDKDTSTILQRADKLLYKAKATGRNKIVSDVE